MTHQDPGARPSHPASQSGGPELAPFDDATFFHTAAWAEIVTHSFPACRHTPATLRGPDGTDSLLPLFRWRRAAGLLTTAHSSFPFLYGGPVPARSARGIESLPAALAHLDGLGCSYRMTVNPFAPGEAEAAAALQSGDAEKVPSGCQIDHTHVLTLPDSEDAYWEMLTTAKRNDVRRLSKKGVIIEESRRASDVDRVYAHYTASFARWGGPPRFVHPPDFYHALVELGGDAVRFTVARSEGQVIGGAFVIRWNGRAHYLAGYFDHEQRRLRANVLLQVDSIRASVRDGLREYDFLPSGGHRGVEEFKKGLGGVARPFRIFEQRRGLHRLLDTISQLRR